MEATSGTQNHGMRLRSQNLPTELGPSLMSNVLFLPLSSELIISGVLCVFGNPKRLPLRLETRYLRACIVATCRCFHEALISCEGNCWDSGVDWNSTSEQATTLMLVSPLYTGEKFKYTLKASHRNEITNSSHSVNVNPHNPPNVYRPYPLNPLNHA
jgi:hypothetical protein